MSTIQEDVLELRAKKQASTDANAEAKRVADEFKKYQARVLDRMEAEKTTPIGVDGTLFSVNHKIKGNVTDRKAFVRWALEQDESIQEFLVDAFCDRHPDTARELIEKFYEAVMSTALVEYKPDGTELNRIASAHIDDDQPLPPGVGWYPDNYVSQRAA